MPALRKVFDSEDDTERMKEKCRGAIETIEKAEEAKERLTEHPQMLARISKFRDSLGKRNSR